MVYLTCGHPCHDSLFHYLVSCEDGPGQLKLNLNIIS